MARQHGDDPGIAGAPGGLQDDPIAHGREVCTCRGTVTQPAGHPRQRLPRLAHDPVDMRVFERDARRHRMSGRVRGKGVLPSLIPAQSGERTRHTSLWIARLNDGQEILQLVRMR